MTPHIILIGGIPTVGKSTLARKLARQYGMDYLPVDVIAKTIASVTTKEKYPFVHYVRTQDPNFYFSAMGEDEFVNHVRGEAREIAKGIEGIIINNKALNHRGVVMEGFALLPEIVEPLQKKIACDYIVLCARTQDDVRRGIMKRGLWATEHAAKEREIQCAWALNTYIASTAHKYGMHMVPARPHRTLLARVKRQLA